MWNEKEIGERLVAAGFLRCRPRNWVRRTADFVQLVNLQRSRWSKEDSYLNFALWPTLMGEPPSLTENTFPFRLRVERFDGYDISASCCGWSVTSDRSIGCGSRSRPIDRAS